MKTCNKCHSEKPVSEFYTSKQKGRTYTHPHCKVCHNGYQKSWYAANKEKHTANVLRWREENLDKWREYQSKWNGAYYHKVQSTLANRAVVLFEKLDNKRRRRLAKLILTWSMLNPLWRTACHVYELDEWLGAYSGI